MNSHRARAILTTLFVIVLVASIVILAVFADRLSAGSQLVLYAVVLATFFLALATGCYQTADPGEVLIVYKKGTPAVRRGGAFVIPVISQVSRMRLAPMWIEFPPDTTADGNTPINRENRLITKDGLPVTTRARIQIAIGEGDDKTVDASIVKVIEARVQKRDEEIKEDLSKLLGGTIANIIAETTAADLRGKHKDFVKSVEDNLQFKTFGYHSTSPLTIWPVTQLAIDDARLESGDKLRAESVLDILKSAEEIRKIEQEREIDKAKAESDSQRNNRVIQMQDEEKDKKEAEHRFNMKQEVNATELALLKIQREESEANRRIEKDSTTKRTGLQKDKDLADLQVDKLVQDARVKKEEHNLRMAAADATRKEDVLRAQADSEVGTIRLKVKEGQEESAIRLRGEELKQNIEKLEGDLEYQLKKLVLQASTDLGRDAAAAIAAALTKAHVTLIGDPAAATQLATEQIKALGLGVRGKEILALLQDVRLHDAVGSIIQRLRTGGATSQTPTASSAERHPTPGRVDGPADNTFEP